MDLMELRPPAEREAMVEAYRTIARTAREYAEQGRTMQEFAAWMDGVLEILGQPWAGMGATETPRPLPWDPAHCSTPVTTYDGPHKRPAPHDGSVWYKKMQVWQDRRMEGIDKDVGGWTWSRHPYTDGV